MSANEYISLDISKILVLQLKSELPIKTMEVLMTVELIVIAGGLLAIAGLKAQQNKKLKPKKIPVKVNRQD